MNFFFFFDLFINISERKIMPRCSRSEGSRERVDSHRRWPFRGRFCNFCYFFCLISLFLILVAFLIFTPLKIDFLILVVIIIFIVLSVKKGFGKQNGSVQSPTEIQQENEFLISGEIPRSCHSCGKTLEQSAIDELNRESEVFCPNCGTRITK